MNWPIVLRSRGNCATSALVRRSAVVALVLCAVTLMTDAPAAHGQAVSGAVVDSATGLPLHGTVVVLLDSAGARRGATLVDSLGHFVLHAPAQGTYRVRSQQIGIASTVSAPMLLHGPTPVTMTLRVHPLPVMLPTVMTEAQGRCASGAATGDADALWDEAVKALTAATLTPANGTATASLKLRNFVRELDPRTMRVRHTRMQEITAPAQSPYVSPSPDTLAKYGFVVTGRHGTEYYAPDARTLISDAFARGHCLRARPADPAHPELVGVAFEPVTGPREQHGGDIRGTLWIQPKTSELQYLEYIYTGEPASLPDSLAGGRVDFAPLPSGEWIVRNWVIRMPKFARGLHNNGLGAYSIQGPADSVLAAVVETGGGVVPLASVPAPETAAVPVAPRNEAAILYGSVLSDPNDDPVPNAEIVVTSERSARTDTAGRFRITGISPGKYTVVVRHLGHTAISFPIEFAAGDTLARDFVLVHGVAVLDTTHVLATRRALSAVTLGKMAGFYERQKSHIGHSLDSTVLKDVRGPLSDVLRGRFPARIVSMTGGAAAIASSRGAGEGALDPRGQPSGDVSDKARGAVPACYAQVYVDGLRVYTPGLDTKLFDLNTIPADALKGIEFFSGAAQTPVQYSGTGASCGTLLLWTK